MGQLSLVCKYKILQILGLFLAVLEHHEYKVLYLLSWDRPQLKHGWAWKQKSSPLRPCI